jgi:hypothetical protein
VRVIDGLDARVGRAVAGGGPGIDMAGIDIAGIGQRRYRRGDGIEQDAFAAVARAPVQHAGQRLRHFVGDLAVQALLRRQDLQAQVIVAEHGLGLVERLQLRFVQCDQLALGQHLRLHVAIAHAHVEHDELVSGHGIAAFLRGTHQAMRHPRVVHVPVQRCLRARQRRGIGGCVVARRTAGEQQAGQREAGDRHSRAGVSHALHAVQAGRCVAIQRHPAHACSVHRRR